VDNCDRTDVTYGISVNIAFERNWR